MPMSFVWRNKESAMRHGLNGKLYVETNGQTVLANAKEVLDLEIRRACEGLSYIGVGEYKQKFYIRTLRDRLKFGNPASQFVSAYHHSRNGNGRGKSRDAVVKAILMRNLVER